MHDVLSNLNNTTIKCLDKGHVRLVDVMPRLVPEDTKTADFAIVQAARVSYGDGTKSVNEDRGLIRYLIRHSHTTPLEMVEFKFHCKMPIFVARQWIRHRTSNVNEVSGRYSVLQDVFYFPDELKKQSSINKQGGENKVEPDVAEKFLAYLSNLCDDAYARYEEFLGKGISREQARMLLPLNLYTEWYWKCDLHNIFHFLALRCDKHAQAEMRVFAEAMLQLIRPIVPFACEAWDDYHHYRSAVRLSRLEVEALNSYIQGLKQGENIFVKLKSDNKREQAEWEDKAKQFGL